MKLTWLFKDFKILKSFVILHTFKDTHVLNQAKQKSPPGRQEVPFFPLILRLGEANSLSI